MTANVLDTLPWMPIDDSAKRIVWESGDGYGWGPRLVCVDRDGTVRTCNWWQVMGNPDMCGFLDDGGNAFRPVSYFPVKEYTEDD